MALKFIISDTIKSGPYKHDSIFNRTILHRWTLKHPDIKAPSPYLLRIISSFLKSLKV